MTPEPILFLVSNGLLEHKPRMGAAIWEYLWFIDRVTKDEPDGSGKFNGLVLGGQPVSALTIARDLREHVNTAATNIKALESAGYIIRRRRPDNRCSYVVTNSKKWFWNRNTSVGSTPTENCVGGLGAATENCLTLPQKPVPAPTENCVSNKEDTTETRQKEKRAPLSNPQKRKIKKSPLPANFRISERVHKWAVENGHNRLQERLEHFCGYCRAHGATYVDHDEAFMNAIRSDWAKLNGTVPVKLSANYISASELIRQERSARVGGAQ
jgi:hypothetical protein